METIKVNMTPCEDIKTIHASQNDTEAREWEFELHNNGEVIDANEITDQITFKAYEGGTEELLPSGLLNGSVDLGSLTWTKVSGYSEYRAVFTNNPNFDIKPLGNILCAYYETLTTAETYRGNNKGISIGNLYISVGDTTFTDLNTFVSAMSGVKLWYEKNDNTPTTSPFFGDIRYPQGLLSDQEFLYRQSPTEEDGLAKITDIKGNTLKWNQLQPNNISRTNAGITYTYNNGKLTVTGTATSTSWWLYGGLPEMSMKANHKYLIVLGKGLAGSSLTTFNWYFPNSGHRFYTDKSIITINSDTDQYLQLQIGSGYTIDAVFYPQVFDLTLMFGSGNEPTSIEEFRNLFPLDYYPYNSGSLIPFNGNGIKTVGKNLINYLDVIGIGARNGTEGVYTDNTSVSGDELIISQSYAQNGGILKGIQRFEMKQGEYVTISGNVVLNGTTKLVVGISNYNGGGTNNINNDVIPTDGKFSITLDAKSDYPITGIFLQPSTLGSSMVIRNLMVERGSVASNYVPYTESLLNLPISTYFPTGMKSAGSVYDELTENKATTRIGAVTFNGSENWYYDSNNALFQCAVANGIITNATTQYNVYTKNNRFEDKSWATRSEGSLGMYYGASYIFIKSTQFADVNAIKTWLQSNPVTVYYELATESETSFTTASLVTENAEIPLSNEDGTLVGKCTEQLSSESGFFDAKIKLADTDGECYSNKIQLHVERSPQ